MKKEMIPGTLRYSRNLWGFNIYMTFLYNREQKRMLMQMEDLQNKMKDIQFMKVTREIQLVSLASHLSPQSFSRLSNFLNMHFILIMLAISPKTIFK